jgi:hypothetical protein
VVEGKKVTTIVLCCTKKGFITSSSITAMLEKIDKTGIFSCSDNMPDPLILLDGYGRQFDLPFLEYVYNIVTYGGLALLLCMGPISGKWDNQKSKMSISTGK